MAMTMMRLRDPQSARRSRRTKLPNIRALRFSTATGRIGKRHRWAQSPRWRIVGNDYADGTRRAQVPARRHSPLASEPCPGEAVGFDACGIRGSLSMSVEPGPERALSLDPVMAVQLDQAAAFVVDLLADPGRDIRVHEGQLGLSDEVVVPGHPDGFALEPLAPVAPGTVWAVDGGSSVVADGRSFQVAAYRAARVRFRDGRTDLVESPPLSMQATSPESMLRIAREALTDLLGAPPEHLPEPTRPHDALREWAEWRAGKTPP